MISTSSRSSHLRSARQGFSLIEVAIALVIFVIGALAIIRIFPGALSVIGNNGDQQIATNLNRSVAARLSSENAVPYANFNIAVNNDGSLQWATEDNTNHTDDFVNPSDAAFNGDIDASVIGVPRFNNSLPTPEDITMGANNSALSRFRGIQGERVKLMPLTENGSTVDYVLTQFPISFGRINKLAGDVPLLPTISQEYTIQNARIDKSGKVTFTDATILFGDKTIRLDAPNNMTPETAAAAAANFVPAKSTIYVSYRYFNADTQIWSVNDEPLPIPADVTQLTAAGVFLTVNPPTTTRSAGAVYNIGNPTTTGAVAEAIDVRVKRYIGVGAFGPAGDPNPDDTGYPTINQVGDARRGMVRVNTPTNASVPSAPIFVDYIADWSLLMQQGVPLIASDMIPNAKQVALGAPYVEDREQVGMYSLLLDKDAAVSSPFFSPFRSQFGTGVPPLSSPGDKLITPTEDELRAGKATFSVTDEVLLSRVAYRTRSNWVQQLSVAAKAYKPYATRPISGGGSTVTEPWRDYYLGNDNYLYFHAGEAGKTISVSYLTSDANGPLVDRPFVVETQLVNAPSGFYSGLAARVKLTDKDGTPLPNNTTTAPTLITIQAVEGSSVTVRTAYINGTKYAQTLLTSNRGAK